MTPVVHEVFAALEKMGVAFDYLEHPPVTTMADCAENDVRLGALTPKNYFLTTKNQKNFFLCIVRPDARFRTADISRQAGSARLSFGTEEQMARLLRVHPGAVSPMGLIFDSEMRVRLLVDSALRDAEKLAFHPCDSGATLAMRSGDFFNRFLPAVNHEVQFVEIHDFLPQARPE